MIKSAPLSRKMIPLRLRSNPSAWLVVAAIFHILTSLTVTLIGRFQILRNIFDPYGVGKSFAIDGVAYHNYARQMIEVFLSQGLSPWLTMPAPLHCRLYSISLAVFSPLVGDNILAIEPLNLLYYLGTLVMVYLIGREISGPPTGFVAALVVGIWPSVLIHTTQFVRDPLSNLGMLALILILTLLLTRVFLWRRALVVGLAGTGTVTLLWLARGNFWLVVVATLGIAALLIAIRMLQTRRFLAWNLAAVLLLFLTAYLVPSHIRSTVMPNVKPPENSLVASANPSGPRGGVLKRIATQIERRRAGFRVYESQASNLDSDVYLNSWGSILRYLPRAAVIGFFAPFPRMWFHEGKHGLAARVIAGMETLTMYFLYLPIILCLWQERSRLSVWLLFLTATVGIIGLGLVVVNAGALFRLRYVFWIMLIILAAEGALIVARKRGFLSLRS